MPAKRIHLVRHGEVYNPGAVLYGRLPNFHLSDKGKLMAQAAAEELQKQGFPIRAIFTSPLIRTQESAKPIEELAVATAEITRTQDTSKSIEVRSSGEIRASRSSGHSPFRWQMGRGSAMASAEPEREGVARTRPQTAFRDRVVDNERNALDHGFAIENAHFTDRLTSFERSDEWFVQRRRCLQA